MSAMTLEKMLEAKRMIESMPPAPNIRVVSDPLLQEKRSWKERLFTRPWKPLVKFKASSSVYKIDGTLWGQPGVTIIMCAPQHYQTIKATLDRRE